MSSRSSQNLVNKWRCDLNSYSKSIAKTTDSSLDPIGYFPGFVASQKVFFFLYIYFIFQIYIQMLFLRQKVILLKMNNNNSIY